MIYVAQVPFSARLAASPAGRDFDCQLLQRTTSLKVTCLPVETHIQWLIKVIECELNRGCDCAHDTYSWVSPFVSSSSLLRYDSHRFYYQGYTLMNIPQAKLLCQSLRPWTQLTMLHTTSGPRNQVAKWDSGAGSHATFCSKNSITGQRAPGVKQPSNFKILTGGELWWSPVGKCTSSCIGPLTNVE